jgi:putative phage-type endonuclease
MDEKSTGVTEAPGLGASSIAGVVGISPFGDAWQVYAQAMGLITVEQSEEMFWGLRFQREIAQVFSERMDLPIEWCDRRIYHPTRTWQYASPDAFVLTEPRELLEVKMAGLRHAGEWDRDAGDEDGVPDYYLAQVAWQLSVTELETAWVAVLIAGNDFRVYKIRRDLELEAILVEEGERFWSEYLVKGVAPPIGGSATARDYLKQRYPREKEKLRPASSVEVAWLNEYAQLRAELDQRETRREELENQLKQAIGEAEGVSWLGGKLTWKKTKDRSSTDWEELARSQLVGYAPDEQAALIQEHTHPVPGSRRLLLSRAKGGNHVR